jgi:hypothetical protein
MTLNGSIAVADRADTLRARLDDPKVVEALSTLLDHADLLAILVSGLDAFISRGDTIADSLGDGLEDLRATGGGGFPAPADLGKLVGSLGTLTGTLGEAAPLLERVIASDVTTQPALDVVSLAARALIEGHARAQASQARVQGVRAMLKLLKDDDLGRGLGFVVEVGRALGRELDREGNTRT